MDSYPRSSLFGLRDFRFRITARDLLITLSIMGGASLVAFLVRPWKGEVTGAMIFMLGITLAGGICGLAAAVTAAVSAFILYNFYFAEPVLTFRIATGADVTPLIAFNLCAIMAGVLAGRLRDYGEAAESSNSQLKSLLKTSRALQAAIRMADIQEVLASTTSSPPDVSIRLFPANSDAPPAVPDHGWALYPLDGSTGAVGTMVVSRASGLYRDQAFMTAFANVLALAVERAALFEEITESRATARTEELKSALLASVSHDFRTPLTTISASASSLVEYRDKLDDQTVMRMLRGIVDECDRLNRYTANILELSRLEAGLEASHFKTLSVADLINSVLQRVRPRLAGRTLIRKVDAPDLLIRADAALFELMLVNIFDNAILYSEEGSRITIECVQADDECLISVSDEGRGIAPAELDRVFERFFRSVRGGAAPPGSGLGLAIVKGFVAALGGSVRAVTPGIDGNGTRIDIRMPAAREVAVL